MNKNVNFFENKRILITGASGFIGRYLVKELSRRGAFISMFDRESIQFSFGNEKFVGDLRETKAIDACVQQSNPDIIFHLAASKERSSAVEDFYRAIEINLVGSLNLFSAAAKLKTLNSIVVMGTAEEYGHTHCPFVENAREVPVSVYSFSKLCVTKLCEVLYCTHKLPFVIVRPSLVYGPGQDTDMFLPALIDSLVKDKPFPMTLGAQTRDFIYISDIINALILAVQSKESKGQVINIGSGLLVTIADIALMVGKMLNKVELIQFGKRDYRFGEIKNYFVDNSKAKKLLDWKPMVDLEDGLRRTIDFFKGVQGIQKH